MPMRFSGAALRRAARVGVLPVSLLATAAIVAGSSYSVFSSDTTSPNNSFNTGAVVLTNDSPSNGAQANVGSALFTVGSLTPTSAATVKCITVQSNDTLAAASPGVKLYVTNVTNTNSLATYLNLTVEIGTATSTGGGACNGFTNQSTIFSQGAMSGFLGYTSFSNGLATGWTPANGSVDSRVFRITVQPMTSMTNTQQASQVKLDFNWEADSN